MTKVSSPQPSKIVSSSGQATVVADVPPVAGALRFPKWLRSTAAASGSGTWGLLDQAVVSLGSFFAAAVVGRVAGADQLGIYSLAVSIFWLVAGIPNALVWTPYTSRAPRMPLAQRRDYAGSGLIHLFAVSATIAIVLLAIGVASLSGLTEAVWLGPMCLALIPFTLGMALREHLRRMLFVDLNTRGLLLVDLPIALGQMGLLLWLANTEKLTFATALLAMALPCLWSFVWIVQHRKHFRFDSRCVREHWSTNFRFGRWLVVVSLAWLLGDGSFRWLLGWLHGFSALGQFAAALTTVMFVNPLMLTVQNLVRSGLSNHLAEGSFPSLAEKTRQYTLRIAAGFGLLFLLLALVGGNLVQVFFGDEFAELEVVVGTLCLGMYIHVFTIPAEGALAALEEGRAMLVASLIRLGLIGASGMILIGMFGPLGVGLTMAISSCGAAIAQWSIFRRRCRYAA